MKRTSLHILTAFLLTGCIASKEQLAIDGAIVEERTKQTEIKASVVKSVAQSCVPSVRPVRCEGLQDVALGMCIAMANQALSAIAQAQNECVQVVATEAADFAVQQGKTRYESYADIAGHFTKMVSDVAGKAVPVLLNKDSQKTIRAISGDVAAISGQLGRPNIDNSSTVTTTTNEDNDTTTTVTSGDTTSVGRDQAGGDIAGRDQTGGNRDDRSCTGEDCRIDSPGDNQDNQDNSDNSVTNPDEDDENPVDPRFGDGG